MRASRRERTYGDARSAGPRPRPRLAGARDEATASPALDQLDALDARWRKDGAPPARWSRRRTAAFVGLTCGGFWACVIAGAAQLLH
jgi:hypothetical protein